MNLKEWLKIASKSLNYQECVYLARTVLETQEIDINLSIIAQKCLNIALQERIQGMPLAKIIEKKHFMNDCFITTRDTLDPRPETEYLIEKISLKPRTILDLGTGTGCLILSILKKFPKAKGRAIDISPKALKIAKENAAILGLTKRIEFLENNWATGITGHFDLIVANPPYVSQQIILEEAKYDPALALFGDETTYKALFDSLNNITFHEMLLEVPEYLLKKIIAIAPNNIEYEEIYNSKIYVLKITQ